MKVTLFTNYVNHHQIPVADELYRLLGNDYTYVEISDTRELVKAMSGYSIIERPYVVRPYMSTEELEKAKLLAVDSDIALFSTTNSLSYARLRYKMAKDKISFEVSERWLKKGLINVLSPRLLRNKWLYHTLCPKHNTYMLCQSAYTASDEHKLFSYKNRCLKWGYFTQVQDFDIDSYMSAKRKASTVKILWVARFLQWKHPERMLQLASLLRRDGIDFSIDMIGEGPEFKAIESQIVADSMQDCVHLLGVMPNSDILKKMRDYHIFCFTSDSNEGWGAVLNESMAAACCPVACRYIGSAPFLIKDGENGLLYDDKKEYDLYEKVRWLIQHPIEREEMSRNAFITMTQLWNPTIAAKRLLNLCDGLLCGELRLPKSGPISKAQII